MVSGVALAEVPRGWVIGAAVRYRISDGFPRLFGIPGEAITRQIEILTIPESK